MRTILLKVSPIFLLLAFFSCSDDDELVGSQEMVTESRPVDDFNSIVASGILDIRITSGSTQSVAVRADDNIIGMVTTTVTGSTLAVGFSSSENTFRDVTIQVEIVVPDLVELRSEGVTNISLDDLTGIENLTIINSGVNNIEASGDAQILQLDLSGTGSFAGFQFETDTCTVNLTGVGNAELWVNNLLQGSLTGVGNIEYRGEAQVTISKTGLGEITKVD